MSGLFHLMHSLLASTWLLPLVLSYNVDVKSPYVVKGDQTSSFFGFSTALHIYEADNTKYILVGAPRANWTSGTGSSIDRPGAVYKCPLVDTNIGDPTEEFDCTEQILYLTDDNVANEGSEDKTNQWLGVNIESSNGYVTACAHRYTYSNDEGKDRVPIGKCTIIGPSLSQDTVNPEVKRRVVTPCKMSEGLNQDTNSCSVGFSQVQHQLENKDAYLLYGSPGEDMWEGSAYLSEHLTDVKFSKKIEKTDFTQSTFNLNQYNGYGVAICSMSGKDSPIDFITSAPRADNYLGKLYFYNSKAEDTQEKTLLKNSKLKDDVTGDQMGAYFGYSLACGDLDNDGNDDLLVSAPWYSVVTKAKSSIVSVGRVYVYNGDPVKVVQNANQPVIIEAPSTTTSAFGVGLALVGDINRDGFQDFAIGAPYENDMKGAVYIYHGSYDGIKTTPAQSIYPSSLGNLGVNLKTFGWSISANKDMDDNNYPDLTIGSYMSDRVVYLRSLSIIDLNIEIVIPPEPVDLDINEYKLEGSDQSFPGTTLMICFTPKTLTDSESTPEVLFETFLDYKQSYAPRAFFQDNSDSDREFQKKGSKIIRTDSKQRQCTDEWTVYLKKKNEMFDDKNYIEVSMTAYIKESDTIKKRAVLKQEQVDRAKGKIVIKSICDSDTGICQCDIALNKPSVKYYPVGYNSVVLNNVNQVVVEYEVENKGPEDAHLPTLKLELPPKVYFIRRTPVGDQTEADVSTIACSEIEEEGKNYVLCFLPNPLPVGEPSKFGISLDTMSLIRTEPINLVAEVSIGSPSEEDLKYNGNNRQELTLEVGEQANLEIRGMSATEKNAIKPYPVPDGDLSFLRSIKLEVRHTVSVSVIIEDNETEEMNEEGIKNIVVEVNWPMKDKNGEYLLYLSEVYVKDTQIKDNFVVTSNAIDPDCLFDYNSSCEKSPTFSAVESAEEVEGEGKEEIDINAAFLNTNCSVPDPGCVNFNISINLLKAGSINMKKLEFEMRSIIWLPNSNIQNRGDFNATSTARIVSVGQNLVIRPGSFVEMKTQVYEETSKEKGILWIIVGSVVGGLLILAILIVALWKLGFFKRKMPPKDGV